MAKYSKISSVIIDKLYPFVEKAVDKNFKKLKNVVFDFINDNSEKIYDIAPYDVIYFTQKDIDNIFKSLGITEEEVCELMEDCFYWNIPCHPAAAKEPYVLVLIMVIRYLLKHNMRKDAEIITIYLIFSGKFYASLFTGTAFPAVAPSKYRTVMDYVVNNMLTNKHDLKSQGNMFNAIRSMAISWLNAYEDELIDNPDDDRVKLFIQQIRDRLRSFLMNIAKLYYEAYENKNYLNYETDNLSDGKEFRITDNDSMKATRYTEVSVNYLVSNNISLQICNKCKDSNIKATEIKDIMECIIGNKNNIDSLYRVINILICDFMRNNPGKSIGSVDFMANSLKMKPNSKDKYIVELKSIILSWLDENSAAYRKRKHRLDTAISYYRAVLMYLVLAVSYACLNK